ncbi:MAG TPA: hypothetical protein VGY77_00605 [Gemmataceae bacterium]|jgi:hypothetical protein|nr:hypothetical protein [Gemmataceae bacterium]
MPVTIASMATWELEDYIEGFEKALARDDSINLADFLPPSDNPLYPQALSEIIRSDMEFSFRRGTPRKLEDYGQRFPGLFQDPHTLKTLAFEEYRLRRLAGETPSPREYQERFGFPIGICPRPQTGKKD